MNEKKERTETDERVHENRHPSPAPPIEDEHDDRSPLDVAFPPPEKDEPTEQGHR